MTATTPAAWAGRETARPVVWAVHMARRITRPDGYHTTRHLPTFYVYASCDSDACKLARRIVDDYGPDGRAVVDDDGPTMTVTGDDGRAARVVSFVVSCGPVWSPVGVGDTGPGGRAVR